MLDTSKIKKVISILRHNGDVSEYGEWSILEEIKMLEHKSNTHIWVSYSWDNPFSHPPAYGSYFVQRKDGKIHWEIWNGAGWAYNEKVITHWAKINPPKK
jgi:hypothetical protein